eukprot:gene28285-35040_t
MKANQAAANNTPVELGIKAAPNQYGRPPSSVPPLKMSTLSEGVTEDEDSAAVDVRPKSARSAAQESSPAPQADEGLRVADSLMMAHLWRAPGTTASAASNAGSMSARS